MATKTLKTAPKISVKIWRPILDALDKKIESACLRRDAFLNAVLESELDRLDDEVSIPNSQDGYDYVFEKIDLLDRKLVSLALSPKLIERLNEICRRKRVVRDAFFNRLFLLLGASPKVIDTLLFGSEANQWRNSVWNEIKDDSSAFQSEFYPLAHAINPFWAIRLGIEQYYAPAEQEDYIDPQNGNRVRIQRDATGAMSPIDSLYTVIFQPKVQGHDLLGLSCYMPDWLIPGHGSEQKHKADLDELLGILS